MKIPFQLFLIILISANAFTDQAVPGFKGTDQKHVEVPNDLNSNLNTVRHPRYLNENQNNHPLIQGIYQGLFDKLVEYCIISKSVDAGPITVTPFLAMPKGTGGTNNPFEMEAFKQASPIPGYSPDPGITKQAEEDQRRSQANMTAMWQRKCVIEVSQNIASKGLGGTKVSCTELRDGEQR